MNIRNDTTTDRRIMLASVTIIFLVTCTQAVLTHSGLARTRSEQSSDAASFLRAKGAELTFAQSLLGGAAMRVDFEGPVTVDRDVIHKLSYFKQITDFYFDESVFDIGALERLSEFKRIQGLYFSGTNVSDADLQHIGKLIQLEWLKLAGSDITDAGLGKLSSLTKLTSLNARNTALTDDAIPTLLELRALRVLDLGHTGLTEAGIRRLSRLKNLRDLRVEGIYVSDRTVAHLREGNRSLEIRR